MKSLNEKFTPDFVVELEQNDVFVFGSNLNGVHAGGASLMALQSFGAEWGKAEGPQGQCYAIPTDIRGEAIDNVSAYMKRHIDKFTGFKEEYRNIHTEPKTVGVGTYARHIPGTIAFGIQAPWQTDQCHQANEHAAVSDYLQWIQIIKEYIIDAGRCF